MRVRRDVKIVLKVELDGDVVQSLAPRGSGLGYKTHFSHKYSGSRISQENVVQRVLGKKLEWADNH